MHIFRPFSIFFKPFVVGDDYLVRKFRMESFDGGVLVQSIPLTIGDSYYTRVSTGNTEGYGNPRVFSDASGPIAVRVLGGYVCNKKGPQSSQQMCLGLLCILSTSLPVTVR